ncbi:FkbM family methyltransferase [Caulobacter sp. FWC2]|uniref:FkbM family methyltransferase n=1 Tax=Caulobacter sp. FWC2 TaxID=69664 RepID=UPI000C147DFA|nr:FkbM family methyltransferase [Caulobacter sp. FWC2]PIB93420.1 methyltransferase [Caulobacter sp. FWC2]
MRPVRLDLAISSAMRAPAAVETPHAQPEAPPPAGPPPRRRFAFARRLLAPVLAPVAGYARRYLQASVEHELRETQGQIKLLAGALDATQGQLDHTQSLLHLVLQQQQAAALATQAIATHLTRIEAETIGARELSALAADHGVRIESQAHKLEVLSERAIDDLARLPGLFGPRFDELEIKARPLIHYDAESTAIRMRDGYILAPTALPTFVTMLANATSRGLEPGTGDVLRRLVQPGMVVADVGANIGLLTLVMAWAAGPGGKVIAFEPEAIPRANLEKMRHLNGLSWVEVRDQAVGAEPGQLTFHVSDIIGHSSLYALPETEGSREIQVEVVRLDSVAPAQRMDVVKIDVEGAELDVLAGMSGLIAKNKDLAIVAEFGPEHLKRVGQTPAQWFKAFADAGFKAYIIDETTGAAGPTSAKAAAKVVSANIAFVRAGGDAEKRLLRR